MEQRPIRRKMSDTRNSITHKFCIEDHDGYITVGLYDDGTPGEIFLSMAKQGSTVSGLMEAFGRAVSYALQYGATSCIAEKNQQKSAYNRKKNLLYELLIANIIILKINKI